MATVNGDLVADVPNQVIDSKHVTGRILIEADGVTIRNSQIDAEVTNGSSGPQTHSFTITDSTVGTTSSCTSETAIGQDKFTANRVEVLGHGDGFGDAGNNILIQDSFVLLCGKPEFHSDGVQGYLGGTNVVIRHNTIDQRQVALAGQTAPIFISDSSKDATVQDNLLMGGSETIRVYDAGGKYVVSGNRVVDGSWQFGPAASDCKAINWTDNRLVTIDSNYKVTSTGSAIPCTA